MPGGEHLFDHLNGGAVRPPAARHHDAEGGRAPAAPAGQGRPPLQGPAGPHDLLDAARGGDGPIPRPRRRGLHPQAVPGARAAGAGEGASPGGPRAQPGPGRGALPLRDDGHHAGGHGLAQAGRDLPDPRAPGGAGPQHLPLLDHHRGPGRRSRHRRGGVREPDAAQPRRGPAPLSRDPARARHRRGGAGARRPRPIRSSRTVRAGWESEGQRGPDPVAPSRSGSRSGSSRPASSSSAPRPTTRRSTSRTSSSPSR